MPVASMTGFARFESEAGDTAFVWELRSVNGKGLDHRLRLPGGMEAIEADVRRLAAARLTRGNIQISLGLRRADDAPVFTVNEAMLSQVLALSDRLIAAGHAVTPTADGLLAVKGILDVVGPDTDEAAEAGRRTVILAGFSQALDRLTASRDGEGEALRIVLDQRLRELSVLLRRAEEDPARTAAAIREKLARQVRALLDTQEPLDEQRLHQEAAILAAKADIREEIDRLSAHVASAVALLAEGGPIGRKLDFLSQEFNREANTICSKSNATSLTVIGIEMKVAVDQFREQVQNIE